MHPFLQSVEVVPTQISTAPVLGSFFQMVVQLHTGRLSTLTWSYKLGDFGYVFAIITKRTHLDKLGKVHLKVGNSSSEL